MYVMEKIACFVAAVLEQLLVLLVRAFVPYVVLVTAAWTVLALLGLIMGILAKV
jgi:hypothetical protein